MDREQSQDKPERIRVVLIDPHRIATWGVRQLIQARAPSMEVTGSCHDADDALSLVEALAPDVIVLHARLCGPGGGLIRDLVSARAVHVLLLADDETDPVIDAAILAGARGVVSTSEPVDTLLRAIEKINAGELWLDRGNTARLFDKLARTASAPEAPEVRLIQQLTRREREIVEALGQTGGVRNRELAARLGMSEHTLRNHLTSVYDKLDVDGRMQLYAFARKYRDLFELG
ncbi:LuxR C-terminal-related transcriptional regulator [Alkalisalibacterium limincola]|uniref:Response regulator transcription factor n=1 Tax=Alkalisalibacterium limincola TaxID=2699169 RepID=A0A5C8KRK7_9GAMM|nr:response regulator transcription factor [Alkalisalibacterium limincola]TXK62575.1 response regulator transcription factor [Alkalisalibacterium limincola]